jgi:hypothetical protein
VIIDLLNCIITSEVEKLQQFRAIMFKEFSYPFYLKFSTSSSSSSSALYGLSSSLLQLQSTLLNVSINLHPSLAL